MSRPRPPSRDAQQGPPQLEELFCLWSWPLSALRERYGSIADARAREEHLCRIGVLAERDRRLSWTEEGGPLVVRVQNGELPG